MFPESEKHLEAIFSGALDRQDPDARAAFLDDACAGDADLRRAVEALLAAHAEAGSFLNTPPVLFAGDERAIPATDQSADPDLLGETRAPMSNPNAHAAFHSDGTTTFGPVLERPGAVVGRYKLLQQIGEGGFGVVFLAEQDKPVRRRVALKIIKLGMDTRQVVARFEQERQALALMEHPHIARVLDAGATASGRPYFVMEYVVGDPITKFADAHKLSVPERLALFQQVCLAVQHAHHKGVIHRDIKPRNVLVSMVDGKPLAKVIDFGIAKATGARLTDMTLFTEHRQLIGTPEYMSPEQAEGSPDIDTRTDVYSLGVLLYELLTGATPFDAARLRASAMKEMQRIIAEEEPIAPSLRLSRSLSTLASTAAARRVEPAKLGALVRGELDWIVMKALDKDRARRYETPRELAEDVSNHMSGVPVSAAPPSMRYRMRKFVRRHRFGVASGTAITVALIFGIIGTSIGLRSAIRQREIAEANGRRAELAQAAMLAGDYAGVPESADWDLTTALEIRRRHFGNKSPIVADTLLKLANGLHSAPTKRRCEILQEALSIYRHVAEKPQSVLSDRNPSALEAAEQLIDLYFKAGQFEPAHQIAMEILNGAAVSPWEDVGRLEQIRLRAASILNAMQRYDEADRMIDEGTRIALANHGPESSEHHEWRYHSGRLRLARRLTLPENTKLALFSTYDGCGNTLRESILVDRPNGRTALALVSHVDVEWNVNLTDKTQLALCIIASFGAGSKVSGLPDGTPVQYFDHGAVPTMSDPNVATFYVLESTLQNFTGLFPKYCCTGVRSHEACDSPWTLSDCVVKTEDLPSVETDSATSKMFVPLQTEQRLALLCEFSAAGPVKVLERLNCGYQFAIGENRSPIFTFSDGLVCEYVDGRCVPLPLNLPYRQPQSTYFSGIALDNRNHRLIAATSESGGIMYSFDLNNRQWSQMLDLGYSDLVRMLTYDDARNEIIALPYYNTELSLIRMDATGQNRKRVPITGSRHVGQLAWAVQMAVVDGSLMVVTQTPPHGFGPLDDVGSVFKINIETGEARCTSLHWKLPQDSGAVEDSVRLQTP